jgi:hypothetical protein
MARSADGGHAAGVFGGNVYSLQIGEMMFRGWAGEAH